VVRSSHLLALRTAKPGTIMMMSHDFKPAGVTLSGSYGGGNAIARGESYRQERVFRVLRKEGSGWKTIHRQQDAGRMIISGLTEDATAIIAFGAVGGERTKAWAYPLDGAAAKVGSRSAPATYYMVDFRKGTADIIDEDYPALAAVPLGTTESIWYKARDGADIPAYVTAPPGVPAKNLPMVVLPHDGPESRNYPSHFDWMAQFLATRGYVVFQPQFRGSTGFGEKHRKAGYRQWGGLMQDDITDGVKALIEQHVADPRRICIVGTGYGGYAALAGAAFTPDVYAW